jgi:hypothetical protein
LRGSEHAYPNKACYLYLLSKGKGIIDKVPCNYINEGENTHEKEEDNTCTLLQVIEDLF